MHRRQALAWSVAALATPQVNAQLLDRPVQGATWTEKQKLQGWATAQISASPRRHGWVEVRLGQRTLKAFVTWPDNNRRAPAVLVLHEVFGLTESTLATADTIAAMGYVTIAPHMLSGFAPDGRGTDGFPTSRMTSDVTTMLPDATVDATLNAWSDYAARLPETNGAIAIVGLSWEGGAAFRYAASGARRSNLRAVCVFYDVGPPAVTQDIAKFAKNLLPMSVERIAVPVYGFYPDQDTRVMASLPATRNAMKAVGKAFDAVIYPGAEHTYLRLGGNPADPNPANAAAARARYARLKNLLGTL